MEPRYKQNFLRAVKKARNRDLLEAILITIMGYTTHDKDEEWRQDYFEHITETLRDTSEE
jgi:hypothetical protein